MSYKVLPRNPRNWIRIDRTYIYQSQSIEVIGFRPVDDVDVQPGWREEPISSSQKSYSACVFFDLGKFRLVLPSF